MASLGVSCESCHGAAVSWLRTHTRPDLSHDDRVAAGMRDLKNLYTRANTCVACHQNLDADLAKAGHPELLFELDGQCVTQPKHWRERNKMVGPQAWFVGQAVALREMSWQLSREKAPDEKLLARWQGLLWLLQTVGSLDENFPGLVLENPGESNFGAVQKSSDDLAKRAAEVAWTGKTLEKCLQKLIATSADFRKKEIARPVQARRAERLVLGLDRLVAQLDAPRASALDPSVSRLFKLTQSLPDFAPEKFAQALDEMAGRIKQP